jgi:hypothetical protein
MVSQFKFFQKNPYRNRCRLVVGSAIIFKGYYCIVTQMLQNDFRFTVQETGFNYLMSYKDYLTTPSAAGRQLNRI